MILDDLEFCMNFFTDTFCGNFTTWSEGDGVCSCRYPKGVATCQNTINNTACTEEEAAHKRASIQYTDLPGPAFIEEEKEEVKNTTNSTTSTNVKTSTSALSFLMKLIIVCSVSVTIIIMMLISMYCFLKQNKIGKFGEDSVRPTTFNPKSEEVELNEMDAYGRFTSPSKQPFESANGMGLKQFAIAG